MSFSIPELIGYAASIFVVISLMMTSVLKFRLLNLAGGITFLVYGWLIGSIPVAATNVVIIAINLWFLWKATTSEDYFSLLEVTHESPYLRRFLEFHGEEIERFVPGFEGPPGPDSLSLLILRDMIPAGVFIGHTSEPGVLIMDLDYAIPQYRDFKLAEYLYEHRRDVFEERGIHTVRAAAGTPTHGRYLREVGFEEIQPGVMELRTG